MLGIIKENKIKRKKKPVLTDRDRQQMSKTMGLWVGKKSDLGKDQGEGKKKEELVETREPSRPVGKMAKQTKKGETAYPPTVSLGVGGGEGQTRYEYDEKRWLGGR